MYYENHHFKGQNVRLDGHTFVRCRFTDCELTTSGQDFSFQHCAFDGKFGLNVEGLAMNVVRLLQLLNNVPATKHVIDAAFKTASPAT